jgi:hypothetical protein
MIVSVSVGSWLLPGKKGGSLLLRWNELTAKLKPEGLPQCGLSTRNLKDFSCPYLVGE